MKPIVLIFFLIFTFKTEAQTSVLKLADSLYNYGNYTKAINAYKQYENPDLVTEQIAKAYMYLGNYDMAVKYYQKALNTNPDNALLKFEVCKLLIKTSQFDQAKNLLLELIKADSKNPNYHYQLGQVFDILGEIEQAQNHYLQAYQIDQTHQNAIYELAKFQLVKRAYNNVETYVEKGLETYPNNKKLISLKAQNYYWQERYENSKHEFLKLIELGEKSQFIFEKLSFCYTMTYQYENAIKYLELAIAYNPKDANNLYRLGLYYEKLNDFENAEKYILASLKLLDVPLDLEYRKLGTILNKQKKYDQAIKAFNLAIKENPEDEFSYFYKLNSKLKYYEDISAKISEIEKYQKQFPDSPFSKLLNKHLAELKSQKFQQKK